MADFVPIGERIALYRRRRGLSQAKLAGLVGRSESWLSQVERGARPIERRGVLAELARALDIPVSELTGTTPEPSRRSAEQHRAVEEIRLAVSQFDFLAVLIGPPATDQSEVIDLADLERRADRAWELTHASRYEELAPLLSALLSDAEMTAHRPDGERRAAVFDVLAKTYQAVAAVMAKLGETELAWVAADRSVMAAEQGTSPLVAVVGVYRLALAFLSGWRLDQAERVASSGTLAVASQVGSSMEATSLYGALNLVRAVIASRRGDGATTWLAIAEAERAAGYLDGDRNDFDTEFGPANVALHAVSVAVELGEAAEALRRTAAVNVDGLSAERRGRYLLDVARAHGQRRNLAGVVAALREAFALTPEQIQYHPMARELLRHCLRMNRRRPSRELLRLAELAGVV